MKKRATQGMPEYVRLMNKIAWKTDDSKILRLVIYEFMMIGKSSSKQLDEELMRETPDSTMDALVKMGYCEYHSRALLIISFNEYLAACINKSKVRGYKPTDKEERLMISTSQYHDAKSILKVLYTYGLGSGAVTFINSHDRASNILSSACCSDAFSCDCIRPPAGSYKPVVSQNHKMGFLKEYVRVCSGLSLGGEETEASVERSD